MCTFFQFLNVPMFRNVTLKCLTEIAGVTVTNYEEMFIILFTQTMMTLEEVGNRVERFLFFTKIDLA